MTGRPSALSNDPRRRIDPPFAAAVLSRALTRAWWAVLWERLWPPLATLATAVGAFLIASWAGLWFALPPLWRAVGVCLFGLVLLASAVPLARLALPRRRDALRRLDLHSGLPHRPATTISDDVAAGTEDKGSLALWQAHMVRSLAAAGHLKAGVPQPRLLLRDPYALRALVLILVIATCIGAGGERLSRVTAAFDWRGAVQAANFRIDAWVTPPTYTGKPPVILPGVRTGEPMREARTIAVPTGSVLVIRATGTRLDLATTGLAEGGQDQGTSRAPAGTEERRFTVTEDASVTLRGVANNPTWTFTAIPDRAPTIALAKDPEPQARGSLQLAYKIEDDYGVTYAEAQFGSKGAPAADAKAARPLYDAPNFSLVLPQARTRNGAGQTIKDLTEHPWAGVDVTMTLLARDEAGNEGRSTAHEFKLPQRPFYKPVPKALVEQRRILALDAEARARVLKAIDALTIAPEQFTPEASVYLGLRSIYWLLANAKSDDDLREVVNRLWAMAVQIEDGNISDAEQALRAAQEALRQALERGASEEEIKRLMDQLRAALDKFMQALAEELRKNPQQLARPLDRNARELRPQDLRSMLDRLENLARSGNKDAARQLLEQLQQMLENLQMARPGQQGDGDDDMMSALDELGDMIRREQQLRDRTFRQGQEGRRERQQRGQRGQRGQQGQQGEQGDQQGQQGFDELRQGQQALREQLKKLLEELRKRGQMGQQGAAGPAARRAGRGRRRRARPRRAGDARRRRPARRGRFRRRGRFARARHRRHAQGRAGARAADGAGWPQRARARTAGPAAWASRAPTRTPTRSVAPCADATTTTTSPSRCRARSTCSARAASSRNCAGASPIRCARSSSSNTSSGC